MNLNFYSKYDLIQYFGAFYTGYRESYRIDGISNTIEIENLYDYDNFIPHQWILLDSGGDSL